MANEQQTNLIKQSEFKTGLAKVTESYTNMIVSTFSSMEMQVSDYQKLCVANMIARMEEILRSKGKTFKDINQSNITAILSTCAMLKLNITSVPAECYLNLRNTKITINNVDQWITQFEFGVEGNGNDAILRNFGVDVKKVYNAWLVRENDEFVYPSFDGLEMTPPKWIPKSYSGKVIRIVYPILKNDGTQEYLISEREDVAKNLKAHIQNNLLGSKYKDIRQQIIDKINPMSLDELLSDKTLNDYISPAWLNASSQEQMMIRKMKNNALKTYPKDFKTAFGRELYESTYEDYDQYKSKQKEPVEFDMTSKVEEETNKDIGNGQKIVPQIEKPKQTVSEVIDSQPKPQPQVLKADVENEEDGVPF